MPYRSPSKGGEVVSSPASVSTWIPSSPRTFRGGIFDSPDRTSIVSSTSARCSAFSPVSITSPVRRSGGASSISSKSNSPSPSRSFSPRGRGKAESEWRRFIRSNKNHQAAVRRRRFRRGGVGDSARGCTGLIRRTPMLTVILVKMEGKMDEYCRLMSHPTPENASAAGALLDSSASTPTGASSSFSSTNKANPVTEGIGGLERCSAAWSSPPSESGGSSSASCSGGGSPHSAHSAPNASPRAPSPSALTVDGRSGRFQCILRRTLPVPSSFMTAKGASNASADARAPTPRGRSRGDSLESEPPLIKSSRSFSPPSSFMSGEGSSSACAGGALALESEWERFASPLVLFAGAEALYAQLDHVVSSSTLTHATGCDAPLWLVDGSAQDRMKPDQQATVASEKGASRRNHVGLLQQKARAEIRDKSKKLLAMYQKAGSDIAIVREILCDPLLGVMDDGSIGVASCDLAERGEDVAAPGVRLPSPPVCLKRSSSTSRESLMLQQSRVASVRAALSLSQTLSTLEMFIAARCGGLAVHTDLFLLRGLRSVLSAGKEDGSVNDNETGTGIWSKFLSNFVETCSDLVQSLPDESRSGSCGAALPMIRAIRSELRATCAALSALDTVERCMFFESVLNVQRFKGALQSLLSSCDKCSENCKEHCTPLYLWLENFLLHLLSKMTIFFDRVDAFSGFSVPLDVEGRVKNRDFEDLDAVIQSFLHSRDSGRGWQPMCVGLVLDAGCGVKSCFERGFMCTSSSSCNGSVREDSSSAPSCGRVDGLRSWPAIYLRSNRHRKGIVRQKLPASSSVNIQDGAPSKPMKRHKSATASLIGSHKVVGSEGTSQPCGIISSLFDRDISRLASEAAVPGGLAFMPPLVAASSSGVVETHAFLSDSRHVMHGSALLAAKSRTDNVSKRLEYWPPKDELTWPRMEWPNLVSILSDCSRSLPGNDFATDIAFTHREPRRGGRKLHMNDEIHAGEVSYRNDVTPFGSGKGHRPQFPSIASFMSLLDSQSGESATAASVPDELTAGNAPTNGLANAQLSPVERKSSFGFISGENHGEPSFDYSSPSIYHVVRVGTNLWLVVLLKEEDTKMLRRRFKGTPDVEVRAFLDSMAARLRISRMFTAETVAQARDRVRLRESCRNNKVSHKFGIANLWAGGWHDIDNHQLICNIKSMFGLKRRSHFLQPLCSPSTDWFKSHVRNKNHSGGRQRSWERKDSVYSVRERSSLMSSMRDVNEHGALSFFFGAELAKLLS